MLRRGLLSPGLDKALKHWAGFAWWLLALNHLDRFARHGAPVVRRPGEILLIRLEGIGDFVLFLDLARKLRRLYPPGRFRITLVGARLWTSLAQGQTCFDDIWELDPGRFVSDLRYRYRLLRRVSQAAFSTAINATFSRDFLFGDALIRASAAKTRIGFVGDLYKTVAPARSISRGWYTRLIDGLEPRMMELRKGAALARAVGLNNCEAAQPYLELTASAAHGLPPLFYVLAPGGGGTLRKWPAGQFSRLAERIFARTGWTGMICGGVEDDGCALRITESSQAPLINRAGTLSLPELANTLSRAQLVLGNDTGIVHMAAAVGTAAVCVLGGGHPGRFMPYELDAPPASPAPKAVIHKLDCFGCDWKCVHKPPPGTPAPCVANVSVEAVWAEVQAIIESRESAGAPIDRCAQLDDDRTQWPLKNRGD